MGAEMVRGEVSCAYEAFIASKRFADIPTGFDCDVPTGPLFAFQAACVKWALKRGRAALFEDTGLGKTFQQVTWAAEVCRHTGGNVIIAAPLCVAQQTIEEAAKIGIEVKYCRHDSEVEDGITITNYEMLDQFDLESFVGVVLDESSVIKAATGKTRQFITDAFRRTPYKLSCTATPSPNDWMELGNQAEFLGVMTAVEMLSTFFTHDGGDTGKWRLKGHGKVKFWEWMATWAICIRSPADLGFDGSAYVLPALNLNEHIVSGGELLEGQLFATVAQTLTERRQAKKASMADRIQKVKEIVFSEIGDVEAGVCREATGEVSRGSAGAGETAGTVGAGSGCAQGVHEGVRQGESVEVQAHAGAAGQGERGEAKEVRGGSGISRTDEGVRQGAAHTQSDREEISAFEEVRHDAGMPANDVGCVRQQMRDLRALGQVESQGLSHDRSLSRDWEGSRDPVFELQHGARKVQGQHRIAGEGNRVPTKPWLIWCHLNDEQDALERLFGELAFSVRGSNTAEEKEHAIYGWLRGERPVMISKPSIMGAGLNYQHCSNMIFAGMNDSYEEFYQAVRRCYRFGQKREVNVHIITAETEGAVKDNIKRKQEQANTMAAEMVGFMRELTQKQIQGASSGTEAYRPAMPITIPSWIVQNVENH
jgi:hypothetical protein